MKAESAAVWALAGSGVVSRRRWVIVSTSKTVSPVATGGGGGVSGAGSSGAVVESRRRILRAFFKAWPSRFLLYQESGEEARELRRSGRCTTIYHGASFGEAAFANMSKDKAYLIFL